MAVVEAGVDAGGVGVVDGGVYYCAFVDFAAGEEVVGELSDISVLCVFGVVCYCGVIDGWIVV